MKEIENKYDVRKKVWRHWSDKAKNAFNKIYELLIGNQELIKHPQAPLMKDEYWEILVWNTAWLAADACDDSIPDRIVEV